VHQNALFQKVILPVREAEDLVVNHELRTHVHNEQKRKKKKTWSTTMG